MQKNNIIIKTALAIIAAVLTTGCIFEKMDMPEDLQDVMILLDVSTDAMQTKATPVESESAINTLHIYAFCNDKPAGYMVRQTTQQNESFLMHLRLPALVPGGTDAQNTHNVEFFLVANSASMLNENNPVSLSENTTKVQLQALKYTGVAQNSALPLYCYQTEDLNVAEYIQNTMENHEGHMYLAQKVDFVLTRSLAKISIYAAKPTTVSTNPQILSVNMLQGGTREYGYLFPQSADVLNAIPSRLNDRNLVSTTVSIGALSGDESLETSYTPVLTDPTYLREVTYGSTAWNVPSGNDGAVVLEIKYILNTGSAEKTGYVYMPAIERNNHYKVLCLFSEEEDGKIIIKLSVADWQDTEQWNVTFDYPSYQSPVLPTGNHGDGPFGEALMYYTGTEEGAFSVDFMMTAPVGQTWTPTFIGSATDYEIKIYETGTSTVVNSPVSASDKWYTIKVIPQKSDNVGTTVTLSIAYTPQWATTPDLLMINGTSGNLAWTGTGSTADAIVIRQIDKPNN